MCIENKSNLNIIGERLQKKKHPQNSQFNFDSGSFELEVAHSPFKSQTTQNNQYGSPITQFVIKNNQDQTAEHSQQQLIDLLMIQKQEQKELKAQLV